MKRQIFSVLGVMPEPGGYAVAKFSRTATYKSYQDWVMELTEEGAEKFYNSMYFQYGHASIADLAHLMVIFENISVPARHLLLDDQLIDAQSRSTRYVDYSKADLIIPPEIKKDKVLLPLFKKTTKEMISLYLEISQKVAEFYEKKYAKEKPADMDNDQYQRTMKARAFDISRYLLPCAIPKSMGIIASGRTWERIITKFLSSPLLECQQIGKELQNAICKKEAFNVSLLKISQMKSLSEKQKEEIKKAIAGNNVALPTLVKYASNNPCPGNVYKKLGEMGNLGPASAEASAGKDLEKPDGERGVEMFEKIDPEIDFVTTLFYKILPHSYGQILSAVKKAKPEFLKKVIDLVYSFRCDHDSVLREADSDTLIFDICMDVGGFRDLHRHRNCVHVLKDVTPIYGFDMPGEIMEVGLGTEFRSLMEKIVKVYSQIEKKYPGVGEYILPQATKRRFLMKISPWELQYVTELRTKPQGHFSYREITYQMWELFNKKYPEWGKHFRVTSPDKVDFFKR